MLSINDSIIELNLSTKLNEKLKSLDLNTINDIWILKRKDLKEKGLTDSEIKSIIIALQLTGLDLNKKIYEVCLCIKIIRTTTIRILREYCRACQTPWL